MLMTKLSKNFSFVLGFFILTSINPSTFNWLKATYEVSFLSGK